jgi:hypothetical protein
MPQRGDIHVVGHGSPSRGPPSCIMKPATTFVSGVEYTGVLISP